MLLGLARQAGGTEVTRVVAEVLRFVVVERLRRLDPDRRQSASLQNGHRELLAGDPGLREYAAFESRGRLVCGRKV